MADPLGSSSDEDGDERPLPRRPARLRDPVEEIRYIYVKKSFLDSQTALAQCCRGAPAAGLGPAETRVGALVALLLAGRAPSEGARVDRAIDDLEVNLNAAARRLKSDLRDEFVECSACVAYWARQLATLAPAQS